MQELSQKDVFAVLIAIRNMTIKSLQAEGSFNIPKFAKLKLKLRAAKPAASKNICGKQVQLKPLPACKDIKATPSKTIRLSLSE